MKFQREKSQDIFDELKPLLFRHWKEIAHYQDIELAPDWDLYAKMEDAGGTRAFTARTDPGQLVGYAVFFVRANPHYKNSIQASQDIIFFDQEFRGFAAAKFIVWCDQQLKAEGVQAVYHHVKKQHPQFGKVLEKLSYELVDLIYTRRLDK